MGRVNLSYIDREGEIGSVGVFIADMTAGTFTAQNGLIDDLVTAIAGVSTLNLKKDSRIAVETNLTPARPTDGFAQRGVKWLVRAVDTNGNAVTFHIPGADLDLLPANSENLNLTAGAGLALKDAIEAVVRSNDGDAIVVGEVVYID